MIEKITVMRKAWTAIRNRRFYRHPKCVALHLASRHGKESKTGSEMIYDEIGLEAVIRLD